MTRVLGETGLILVSPKSRPQAEGSLHRDPRTDPVRASRDGGEDEDRCPRGGVPQGRVTVSPSSSPAGPNDGPYVQQSICRSESSVDSAFQGPTERSDLVCDSEYKNLSEDPQTDGAQETK